MYSERNSIESKPTCQVEAYIYFQSNSLDINYVISLFILSTKRVLLIYGVLYFQMTLAEKKTKNNAESILERRGIAFDHGLRAGRRMQFLLNQNPVEHSLQYFHSMI